MNAQIRRVPACNYLLFRCSLRALIVSPIFLLFAAPLHLQHGLKMSAIGSTPPSLDE